MDKLIIRFLALLKNTETSFFRYIYQDIAWQSRMIGITGPRGVGKTTMVLQHIKAHLPVKETLYVTAEDFYFADNRLLDLADSFVKQGGRHLFIDEIHQYKNWSKELKLMYDYYPELQVVFTGSSVLDIKKGAADLSRRALMYHMQGLSFREYLHIFHQIIVPAYSLQQLLNHEANQTVINHPLLLFKDYLKQGYYPFSLHHNFEQRLLQIVNQTLEKDIPFYAEMNVATARKLKQLLAIIAKSVPFKPNFSSIAEMLEASRNNIADYCMYIEEAGMILQLRNHTSGIRGLGKVDKIYLDNTNLNYILAGDKPDVGNLRETFFINQTRVKHEIASSTIGDFQINDFIFEVGGKGKSKKQIKEVANAYLLKDDIELAYSNSIPLWHFGLLY
ncbi:MAG: ATP-binding protein [Pedobacter sp.]|nr:MAG: ATP-binding protein [Pedobacter sp.]